MSPWRPARSRGTRCGTLCHRPSTLAPFVTLRSRLRQVTGEPVFRLLAENFLELINSTRTLVTGGSTHHENWGGPNMLGHTLGPPPLGTVHQESCISHNTLRLASDLFKWSRAVRYVEFMERLQLNDRK